MSTDRPEPAPEPADGTAPEGPGAGAPSPQADTVSGPDAAKGQGFTDTLRAEGEPAAGDEPGPAGAPRAAAGSAPVERPDATGSGEGTARVGGPAEQGGEAASGGAADSGGGGGVGAGGGRPGAGGAAAATHAALAAAVRAVETGERSAASFFNDAPRAAPAARRTAAPTPGAAAGSAATGPAGAGHPGASGGPGGAGAGQPTVTRPAPAGPAPTGPSPRGAAPGTEAGLQGVARALAAGGAPEALARPAMEALGEDAAAVLREDPWQLLAVRGVRPDQADGFARALLGSACAPGDERRAVALVVWLLEQAALAGHSALEAETLRAELGRRGVPAPDEALQAAIAEGAALVFQDAVATPGGRPAPDDAEEDAPPLRILLGLDRCAMAEESAADGLARLLSTFTPPSTEADTTDTAVETETDTDTDTHAETRPGSGPYPGGEAAEPAPAGDGPGAGGGGRPAAARATAVDWEAVASAAGSAPGASAGELVRAVARSGLVVHTGGEAARAEPAAVVAAARSLGLRAVGAAHTADGRRRLAEAVTRAAEALGGAAVAACDARSPLPLAVTVSGLLAGREGTGRDAEGTLELDVLVVVDSPRLDLETGAQMVEALGDGARLLLSGDPNELGPAGPGRLFGDVVGARCCPQVASRTPDEGPVGELVSGISVGELNEVAAPGKEVVVVPVRDPGEAVHRAVQLVADSVPRAFGVPADRTQVITVGHGGAAGTRALNTALKERLNPGPGRFGGFDPGDRVAYSPVPGHTVPGTVRGGDADGLHLDCAGALVLVPPEQVGSGAVRHGWALTAHQAAGTRWPAVVVVVPGDAARGLSRDWVYTAFSRADRHLSVVQGADQALPKAVAEVPAKERTTRLRTLLELQTAPGRGEPHRPH